MTRTNSRRQGFTLVEMLVVMGIIAFLSALVMLAAPSILDRDRARDAASQVQGALQTARTRAIRDNAPRGVRFSIDIPATYPNPTPPPMNPLWAAYPPNFFPFQTTDGVHVIKVANNTVTSIFTTASAYQFIEVPSWLILTNMSNTPNTPFLKLTYNANPLPATLPGLTGGTVNYPANSIGTLAPANGPSRTCTIGNLTTSQLSQLIAIIGLFNPANTQPSTLLPPTLGVPQLSFWTTIIPNSLTVTSAKFPCSCTILLSIYPDAAMGGVTTWVSSAGFSGAALQGGTANGTANGPAYFGIYQAPRPLMGEPAMQMPYNTTVDLSDGVSSPSYSQIGGYTVSPASPTGYVNSLPGYDILFSPSGQLMSPYGINKVFLWVRDPSKGPKVPAAGTQLSNWTAVYNTNQDQNTSNSLLFYSISPYAFGGSYITPTYMAALEAGGEQLLVTVKGYSGATGVSPIFWPQSATQTPYLTAMGSATSP